MGDPATHAAVEAVARESYGRLLAYLAARAGGDLASAEDALAEAFLAALHQWPEAGVPGRPEAWLLTTARRRLIDAQRRGRTRLETEDELRAAMETATTATETEGGFPDERLGLLFVCAHPAIDPAARAPLMLQTVLGVDAARIASAFLVSPQAMGQRLVRAKSKIRGAGVPFRVPAADELGERLEFVLDAIYAAYTVDTAEDSEATLAREAITLARLLHRHLPTEPEAGGLLALLLHCEARRAARLDGVGRYVPLTEQDVNRWNRTMIHEAEITLANAARLGRMGRFQLEAAIQSVHARRLGGGGVPWEAVALLYAALVRHTPALGARVGRALALGKALGAAVGLSALEELPAEPLAGYQPYWAARADLLRELGRNAEAVSAYDRAIGLAESAAAREFLRQRREGCLDGGGRAVDQ